MISQTKHTFCRICEPLCPLIAELDARGAIVALKPDRAHPLTKGYACHKGLSYLDVHNDPDRVNRPLRRVNPRSEPRGIFEPVSWEDALADIGSRLRALRERHGRHALGVYYGNPIAFNTQAYLAAVSLAARAGSRHCFGAGTQDMCNKPAALEAVFGTMQWTIPDFQHTSYLLCFGANPRVSHWTTVSTHRPMHVLQDIRARGGRVRFVNPRRVESVGAEVDELVQIRPDTDVYLMAALLHELDATGGFDCELLERRGRNVAALRAFVARYPAERVAAVTGVSADRIGELAREFRAAPAAATYMSTGVNQGRQGTLAYWLLNMLSFVTGNLGRRGGNYYAKGFAPSPPPRPSGPPPVAYFDTPLGRIRHCFASLPGSLFADFTELQQDPMRALLVLSGNPLLSMGGESRVRAALQRLELIVAVDLYRNATGEFADYILPSADWLEREDLNHIANGVQPEPYVQYSAAVVPPQAERRPDWWIIGRLEQELGVPGLLDGSPPRYQRLLDEMLQGAGLTVAKLCALPSQSALLPQPERESFYADLVAWPDGRVDCCPQAFALALDRCEAIFLELQRESPGQLKVISLRTHYMHNGSLANMAALQRSRHAGNPLHMHPSDAAPRGLGDGDMARVYNANGTVLTPVRLDLTLRPGVVALSHGYGHDAAPGLSLAQAAPGVNVNRLVPTGPGSYEPLSNMSHMNGVPVEVERVSA